MFGDKLFGDLTQREVDIEVEEELECQDTIPNDQTKKRVYGNGYQSTER